MRYHEVLLEARLVKVALLASLEYTVILLTFDLVAVDLHMLLQIGARAEFLIAILTLEWLLTRMDTLVTD